MKSENSVTDNISSELFVVSVVIDAVSDWTAVWIYDPKLHDYQTNVILSYGAFHWVFSGGSLVTTSTSVKYPAVGVAR